jgi:hypothetical protein
MAWSTSKIFRSWIGDTIDSTTGPNLSTDVPKVALYNNSITPDENDTAAHSAYNAAGGAWVNTNEVTSSGQWAAGGVALASTAYTKSTADAIWYDAADTASGATATLAAVFGCLVYDDTLTTPVADQGVCFNYFGGTQSVTSGTFTVVWNVLGLWRITL